MKIDFIPSIKFLTLGLCAMLVPYGPVNAQSEGKILEEVIVTATRLSRISVTWGRQSPSSHTMRCKCVRFSLLKIWRPQYRACRIHEVL